MIEISTLPPTIQILQAVVTLGAAAIAGIWAIFKVAKRREHSPRIEFTVDVEFVGRQKGTWLVMVIAWLDNKGLVRHKIGKFTFDLRIMNPTDSVEDGGKEINFQTRIPKELKKGSWIPEHWEWTFIEPGLKT